MKRIRSLPFAETVKRVQVFRRSCACGFPSINLDSIIVGSINTSTYDLRLYDYDYY